MKVCKLNLLNLLTAEVLPFIFQISTNAPFLTEAVPTRVITPRDHSLVPAQLAWSWILGKGVAKV